MKTFIMTILFTFLSISLIFADEKGKEDSIKDEYKYNNSRINKDTFNKLFKEFKDLLYTDGKKVYDLRVGNSYKNVKDANACRKFSDYNDGRVKGLVYKVIDNETFLLRLRDKVIYVTGNVDASNFEDKMVFTDLIAHIGEQTYKSSSDKKYKLRKCTVLKPVTKELFKDYIKDRKIYRYKKIKERKPARKTLCPKCMGKGQYKDSKLSWHKCKRCKESGTIVARWEVVISWKKVEVK